MAKQSQEQSDTPSDAKVPAPADWYPAQILSQEDAERWVAKIKDISDLRDAPWVLVTQDRNLFTPENAKYGIQLAHDYKYLSFTVNLK